VRVFFHLPYTQPTCIALVAKLRFTGTHTLAEAWARRLMVLSTVPKKCCKKMQRRVQDAGSTSKMTEVYEIQCSTLAGWHRDKIIYNH
jgi:hypothetical protein